MFILIQTSTFRDWIIISMYRYKCNSYTCTYTGTLFLYLHIHCTSTFSLPGFRFVKIADSTKSVVANPPPLVFKLLNEFQMKIKLPNK